MTSQAVPYAARRERERVAGANQVGSPRLLPLLFFTALAVAVFFSMIYLRIAMDRSAFELDTVNDQIVLEESRTLDLRLELAKLQDPQRIATQASQIGLVYPEEQVTLVVTGTRDLAEPTGNDTPTNALSTPTP